ncbi:MAG: response regulator [Lachnospiraceae bacterium]|nr:response regulator [Lachnospiraceae bacterium]
MGKRRRDVILYCSERSVVADLASYLDGKCATHVIDNTEEVKERLEENRPDLFVYVGSKSTMEDLPEINVALLPPKQNNLPVMAFVNESEMDQVIGYFPGNKVMLKPLFLNSERGANIILDTFEELEKLPLALVVSEDDYHRGSLVAGFEDQAMVVEYSNGSKAVQFLKKFTADVIFMDVDMRRMDGLQTTDRIREIQGCGDIPIVYLLSQADKGTLMACASKKAAGYLKKPVKPEELRGKLVDVMNGGDGQPQIKTILIVDDDVMILKTLQGLLKGEYKTVAVAGADQAIKYCGTNVPDLILLDYEMPDKNGMYVLKKLRMDARFNQTPIVMLTGNKEKKTVVACIQSGAQGYLTKPINPMSLRLRVRQYLGNIG